MQEYPGDQVLWKGREERKTGQRGRGPAAVQAQCQSWPVHFRTALNWARWSGLYTHHMHHHHVVSSPGRGMIVDPGNSQKGGGGRGDSWSLSTDSTPSRRGSARPPVKGHLGGPSSPRCPFQEKAQWKSKDLQQNHKEGSLVWVSLLCPLCDHLLLKGDSFPFPKITSTLLYYPALGRPFHHKVSHRLEKQSNAVS